jgi:hypothetical protein
MDSGEIYRHDRSYLGRETLIEALDCAAGAIDTTGQQERALRDELARLH